ncbi:MAG: TonB-dependent receptor [Rubrivivax sp.]
MGSIPRLRAPRKLALSSFVLAASLQAQTVVITGAREPLSVDRLAADVVVNDADAMRASTADSLADLLRREAGVQLSRAGGPGQASGVFLRGANAGQTAVFVDGVRVGSATLGLPALETLSLAQVERIEVLRGPGSSLYGADAVGGVVHVFTKQGGGAPRADVAAAVGGYGSRQASASAGGSVGAWDLSATLAHESSDGVSALRPNDVFNNYNPDRDGYRLDSAQARVGFKPADGQRVGLAVSRNKLNAQYDASEFAPPTFAQDNTPDFRNHGVTQTVALDWRGTLVQDLTGSAKVAHGLDDLESGGNVIDRFTTKRDQAGVQLAWETGIAGRLVGALEATDEKADTTSRFSAVRRNRAAVVELTGDAQGFSWQADLRRDHSSDFGGVTTARLGGAWVFVPGWKLRALAGNTFRAPSFNDLYFPDYGVPTLRPEKGRSVEAGLSWRGEMADAQLTVFRNRVRDLIGYQANAALCPDDPAYAFGCASNVARARLTGATLGGSAKLDAFTLRAGVDFLDAKDADSGQRLPRRASHQENLGLDWSEGAWSAGAALLRLGARPDGGAVLAAETTLDLKAAWRFAKGWSLEAKLLNATDERIEPVRDYQGLGRQAWLGLRWGGTL